MSTTVAKQSQMELVYEGSVKRVFKKANKDSLFFEFTDDYSVFDWGKMPDTIEHKGRSLAILGAYFFEKLAEPMFWQSLKNHNGLKKIKSEWLNKRFENDLYKQQLCSQGARHHFRGLVNELGEPLDFSAAASPSQTSLIEVAGAEVAQPVAAVVCGQTVYSYPGLTGLAGKEFRRLVPLEVIFRFGMPSGSSLQARLEKNPDYAQTLGLAGVPEPNEMFPYPIVEFFTKLEPSDRLLSVQEALMISQLSADQLNYMVELTRNLAMGLFAIFAERGIELWDGKFEFIVEGTDILLADSIGPDELRLLYKGKHLSKELLRQVYRGGAWEQAVKAAKQRGGDWKQICLEQLKQEPKHLPADIKRSIDSLHPMLANVITGKQLFSGQPSLDQFVEAMPNLEVRL
jgi:phosphoribosylaminoimidazole-succinocarboxamide synthase